MSNQKPLADLSPSYVDKLRRNKVGGQFQWSMLWKRVVDQLASPDVCVEARSTYLITQPIMRNSPRPGFLLDELGRPLDSGSLAKRTGIPKGESGKGLRQLVKLGIFQQEGNEVFYDVLMEISARGNQELENSDKNQKIDGPNRHVSVETNGKSISHNKIDEKFLNATSGSISKTNHLKSIKEGEPGRPGSGEASPSADSPIGIGINEVFKVSGAIFDESRDKSVTKQWLAGVKAWPKFKPIAESFAQTVFDCVVWWTEKGKPIQRGMILKSLNHVLKSAEVEKAAEATAKPESNPKPKKETWKVAQAVTEVGTEPELEPDFTPFDLDAAADAYNLAVSYNMRMRQEGESDKQLDATAVAKLIASEVKVTYDDIEVFWDDIEARAPIRKRELEQQKKIVG